MSSRATTRTSSTHAVPLVLVGLLGLLCMAPTPGDVGGCGVEPTALDPDLFAVARKERDCERCQECGLTVPRCQRACDPVRAPDTALPRTCRPLEHDSDVCLRALAAASCETYATYVEEVAPAIPSECEFCKVTPPSAPPPIFGLDASAEGGPL